MSAENELGRVFPQIAQEAILQKEDRGRRMTREYYLRDEAVSLLQPLQEEKRVFGIRRRSFPVFKTALINEEGRTVKVTVSPRNWFDQSYESDLEKARIEINVGDELFFYFPPIDSVMTQRAGDVPSSEMLDKIEELLGVLREEARK